MRSLLGNLGCRFFPFSTLNMPCHFLLLAEFLLKDQLLNIWGFPCMLLAAYNILSLCLVFVSLISMCLGFPFEFILYGTLCISRIWLTISFFMLEEFSTIISSKIFSYPFFFSSSGTPISQMLVCLILFQRSLRLSSVLFILFTLFCSSEVICTALSSSSLVHSSASGILLLIPSRAFLISVIALFVAVCLFFNSSMS